MPRGYITLTTRTGSKPRVACLNIGWYIRNRGIDFTIVTLLSRDLDDGNAVNDALQVTETEAEIDALIEAAQEDEDKFVIIEHRMGDGTVKRERVLRDTPNTQQVAAMLDRALSGFPSDHMIEVGG
jgi:hypothetical protein